MDYFWHALKSKFNLLFLGIGTALSIFLFHPYILLGFLGAEIFILTTFITNKRFKRHVDSITSLEEEAYLFSRKQSKIRSGKAEYRTRFRLFQNEIKKIKKNYRNNKGPDSTNSIVESSLEKLESLENSYVQFLYNLMTIKEFAKKDDDSSEIENKITIIKSELEQTEVDSIRDALKQRIEILEKRLKNKPNYEENIKLLSVQLDTIEETAKYLLDESVHIYDPKLVSSKVDDVLTNMEVTKDTLREIDSFVNIRSNDFSEVFSKNKTI